MDHGVDENDSNMPPKRPLHKHLAVKIAAWLVGGIAVLFVLICCAVAVLLNNERFHNYLLNTIQTRASEALGVRVQLQNFGLHLSTLDVDLYGITVAGAAPYAEPALLQVDHAEASVRIVSLLHGKWYLDSIEVDRPIVRVFVDAHGVSNIPTIKSSGSDSKSSTSVFDLAVRHTVLANGEFYYNNKQSVLAADLHDLEFRASYNVLLQKYSGRVAYADGHLYSGSFRPVPHSLDAEFDATPSVFHLTKATLSSGASQLVLTASLSNYSNPAVEANYDATVDGRELGQILRAASVPRGQVRATGTVHYQQAVGRSLLDSLTVSGDVNSRQLDVTMPSVRAQIRNLAGRYALADGDVTLQELHANLLGGYVTATGTMSDVAGNSHSNVKAALRNVSLAELRRALGQSGAVPGVAVGGQLNAQATAKWGETFNDLVAQTDATVHGQIANGQITNGPVANAKASGTVASAIPIDSAIHGTYTASNGEIALSKSYLRTSQTSLTLNGTVSQRSSLAVRLQADDLREVETIADLFRTPAPGQKLQPLGLAGTASFDGSVQGSTKAPHLTGQLTASNFHVSGSEWKVIRTGVDASPSLVKLGHADLEPASQGRIGLNASVGLTDWSFNNMSPVQVDLDAKQLNVAELARFSGQQIPVAGMLNAQVKLHGSELNPVGNGTISVANLVAYGQPVQTMKVTFNGTGDEAHADLAVATTAGGLETKVSVRPKERTYTVQLSSAGIHLDQLQALKARNVNATGVVALNASGQGSFDNPQLTAGVQIPQLVIQNQTVTGINLQLNLADHVAHATLASSAVNTSIQGKATVNLSGDYLADASIDTQAIPLQPLLAVYAPEEAAGVTGETEVHATLHGPLKNKNLLEAHVEIPVLKLDYNKSVQLAAGAPIRVDYKDGVVNLQRASIKGTDTDLQFQGSIPVNGSGAMSLLLQGTVNLQLAQLFDPDVHTGGQLKFDINSKGSSASDFGGQVQIVDASYSSGDLPVGLQHGNGVLTLSKNRLNISSFQGRVGGGKLTAQGGVTLQPKIQFEVGVSADNLRMLYPQGLRESINADLRLTGSTDRALLSGSINLSDLSFTSAFDLNGFISQFSGGVSSPPSQGFAQNLGLNLAVRSSNDVSLVSRTLSIGGTANLQVRGTAAEPVILGRVNLSNGDIILNGDRFLLEGGTVEFVNPSETEPVLNVSLKTTIQQYDVYLRFNGPVDQMRTNYSSDPALPSADIINLLAFGQTTEASANAAPTSTTQTGEGLIASQVSSQVTNRVSKIAGISQLSINPVLASSNNQGTGANITIQQRVTGNLFVTFTSNVGTTQTQTIQGQYQLSPRVALSATRDPNGGFAFDTLIKKSW
jgi:translocation and assembly module TamB